VLLYETLGPTLPDGAASAAVLWGLCQQFALTHGDAVRRAGFTGDGPALGDRLFDAILAGRSGVTFSVDDDGATWRRLEHADRKIHLDVPELLGELAALAAEDPAARDPAFPFVLAAGERRTSTANTIFRDPAWRRKDRDGALRVAPADAARLGLVDGGRARVTTRAGSVVAAVEITDTLQAGHVTLPNGLGLDYPDATGAIATRGAAPNELTSVEHRDWIAGTPWHKHVPARVEPA
jgi:anaerobic selenocysteine-containing dehydrogenase